MTSRGSLLYVRAGDGASGAPDALEADFDVLVAEGAVDAVKRLASAADTIVCVVTPASLPELPFDAFVARIGDVAPDASVVAVGPLPGDPDEVAALVDVDAYVPDGHETTLAERIRRLTTDARVDQALARHDQLGAAVAAVAVRVAAAEDREAIESTVRDRLVAADGYRRVWIGRPVEDGIAVGAPVAGQDEGVAVEAVLGGGDPGFVSRAVETGRVVATEGTTEQRRAAVPFLHRGQVLGLAVLETDRPAAFDSAERERLADLGAVVGHALWVLSSADARSASIDRSEAVETLIHELRNPLGIAKSHLEIAREDRDFEPLERSATALDRMADTIDRVSVGMGGDLTVEPTGGTLEEDAHLAWGAIDADAADLELEGSAEFRADHDLVVRLLSNLFQNAVEHGATDGSVTVRVGPTDDGFFVEDDGPGIPPTDREAVLERGYSTSSNGLGIGLSLVRDAANAHGWTLSIGEGRDGGARFEVSGVELRGGV